jgi:hypothetical protein
MSKYLLIVLVVLTTTDLIAKGRIYKFQMRFEKSHTQIGNHGITAFYNQTIFLNNNYATQTEVLKNIKHRYGIGINYTNTKLYPFIMQAGYFASSFNVKSGASSSWAFGDSIGAHYQGGELCIGSYLIPNSLYFMPYAVIGGQIAYLGAGKLFAKSKIKEKSNVALNNMIWKVGVHIVFSKKVRLGIGAEYKQTILFKSKALSQWNVGLRYSF